MTSNRIHVLVLMSLALMLALSGCDAAHSAPAAQANGRAGAPRAAASVGAPATETLPAPKAVYSLATPPPTPNAPLKTSTGRVAKVELSTNSHAHLVIVPDVSSMQADFTIVDWSRVTVLNYWLGFQTPTPVATSQQAAVVKSALNHEVTIGYYNTVPPLVVLVSVHKQEGDPQ